MPPLTRVALVDRLCDFFLIATQTILYTRSVYPRHTFTAREMYGAPAYITRSPLLESYLKDTIAAFRDYLIQGSVTSVVLALRNASTSQVVARYVFDIAFPPDPPEGPEGGDSALALGALDAQFRAQLLRLSCIGIDVHGDEGDGGDGDSIEDSGDDELAFDVVLHTTGVVPGESWVEADGAERRELLPAAAIPVLDACGRGGVLLASRIEIPGDA